MTKCVHEVEVKQQIDSSYWMESRAKRRNHICVWALVKSVFVVWVDKTADRNECCVSKTNNPLFLHRCSPALAGQRVCGSLPQGALFPPVGVPSRPAPVAQGDRVPDPEDLGWSFTPAAWRGKTGSSHCWRKVGNDIPCPRLSLGFLSSNASWMHVLVLGHVTLWVHMLNVSKRVLLVTEMYWKINKNYRLFSEFALDFIIVIHLIWKRTDDQYCIVW